MSRVLKDVGLAMGWVSHGGKTNSNIIGKVGLVELGTSKGPIKAKPPDLIRSKVQNKSVDPQIVF